MMRMRSIRQLIAVLVFCVSLLLMSSVAFAEGGIFTEHEVTVDSDTYYFTLEFNEGVEVNKVVSSNTKVVSVEELDDYESFGTCVYLYRQGPGKATITATDSAGNTDTCIVTAEPEPLTLDQETIVLDKYDYEGYYDDDSSEHIEVLSETNDLKSVTSSNTAVAKATLTAKKEFKIIPVSTGTATITATDIYNQTATVTIEISPKYVDEMKYLGMLHEACEGSYMEYGDTQIEFTTGESKNASALKNVKIQVEVGGTNYIGTYMGYSDDCYRYIVKGVPIKPVGTKTKYTLTIGEATYVYSSTIKRNSLPKNAYAGTTNDKYTYIYSGKALRPKVGVDCWFENGSEDSSILKSGRDYKVKYTSNKNVGKAKVTVTGIGNYSGSISFNFTIIPKGTSLAKLKSAKKAMTVTWKKQAKKMAKSRITGYQVKYSLKKNMSAAKTVNVKGYAKTSKKISKLKGKKKYYVQIRTYKKVGSKTYYSKWSAKKTVKTK